MKKKISILLILILLFTLVACDKPSNTPPVNTPEVKEGKLYGVLDEVMYYVGEMYDPLDFITAYDADGNDVTSYLSVVGTLPIENGVLTTEGVYEYELVVIIENKKIISKKVTLIVSEKPEVIIDTVKPVINSNSTYLFMVGDEFKVNVTAIDNIDGDITSKMQVTGIDELELDVNNRLTKAGTYYLKFTSTDKALNSTSKDVIIIVKEPDVYGDIIRNEIVSEEYKDIEETIKLEDYKLVWAEEFNYEGAPDPKFWNYDIGTGNGGWGNQEKQYYTNEKDNVYV